MTNNGFDRNNANNYGSGWTVKLVRVTYNKARCEQYKNTTTPFDSANDESYIGDCRFDRDISCASEGPYQEPRCRLSTRMFAAFTLLGCLTAKATYMMTINFRARGEKKIQCLTFGDVIVASVVEPTLRVHNECMVDSGEAHR